MRRCRVSSRLNLLAIIEGHYASEALLILLRLGVLRELNRRWCELGQLAKTSRVDPVLLKSVLEFARRSTDVVMRDRAGRYRLGQPSLPEIIFQLEKFIGAYGACIRNLGPTLRHARSVSKPDGKALSNAFAGVAGIRSMEAKVLQQIGVRNLLELGCGPASLLTELAIADNKFRGIGVDSSADMCRVARSQLRSAGIQSRIRIRLADAKSVRGVLNVQDLNAIDAVYGRSMLNALFGLGKAGAVSFLKDLRALLPGRIGLFVDYYGELNRDLSGAKRFRLAEVQDLAQLGSGQGIPPPNRKEWDSVFREAGCELVSVLNMQSDDVRWFIRQVRL
jgi:SAM-dependent methyltransferase